MKSSGSSRKRTVKNSSEEISAFDLFYQLTYMSATAAAGVNRSRIFTLAATVPNPTARFFHDISELAEKMRYNYPDACRMVGQRIKAEHLRTFLLRFADALASGEPISIFLAREAEVQSNNYENEYERELESLKKWDDAFTSVAISISLIVIINMVSTMIYDVGMTMMIGMVMTAVVVGFIVAYVIQRAAPREQISVPWSKGSKAQRKSIKMLTISLPIAVMVVAILVLLKVPLAFVFFGAAAALLPVGYLANRAEGRVTKKDGEVSGFYRSIGGTATSRGTTLGQALMRIELKSFPSMVEDIQQLGLRLNASVKPFICWGIFGFETGSNLIRQSSGIFYEATNLGGDPETAGVLCSLFSSRTAMLRAKRKGVAATFSGLTMVMHAVIAALMVFILEILKKFVAMMEAALSSQTQAASTQTLGANLLAFSIPQVGMLENITVFLLIMLVGINAFCIVASEGAHLAKLTYYSALMFAMTGLAFLIIPVVAKSMINIQ
jgi:flagellar protein FlaJ